MRKILFLMTAVFVFAGCSNDDEKGLTLSKKQLSLHSGETEQITVSEDATWESRSSFIATVNEEGVVEGKHVGNTTIMATSASGKAQCEVEVKAQYNTFIEPILEFGASKSTIKAKEKRSLTQDNAEGLGYDDSNRAVIGVAYLFENDRLTSAAVGVDNTYTSDVAEFLLERYLLVGKEKDIYIFINNDMDKYTMAVGLSASNGYLTIMYMPRAPKARSGSQIVDYTEEFKSLLGI